MLVLSRRRGEVMLVDLSRLIPLITSDPQALADVLSKPIAMTVTETHMGSCKLAYDADKLVRIHRIERITRGKKAAYANTGSGDCAAAKALQMGTVSDCSANGFT